MTDSNGTEASYLQKLIAGDESAFRYFIKKYQDMAFTLAVSIVKDEFAAQEVAQDAFMKAFKGIAKFNQQSAFKTWFYRILVNEAFLKLKRLKRHQVQYIEDYETEIADRSLEDVNMAERIEMVNYAFKLMPANEALVLRLFYLEEESIHETCVITGFTESNVKVLLHRARKRMFNIIANQKIKN